ncbi:MAG: hypothetical protein PHV14_10550 [Bacteroidales bacterium]|nr:hypothetical protein [Bacteroidales bacterium]
MGRGIFRYRLLPLRYLLIGMVIIAGLLLPSQLAAQEVVAPPDSSRLIIHQLETGNHPGRMILHQDPRLTQILRRHAEFNKTEGSPGWRLLIFKGKGRSDAFNTQATFLEFFNNLNLRVDIHYEEPDFMTLVGSFRTKEEAFRFQKILESKFPNAYPVKATIFID